MALTDLGIFSLNAGEVSRLALARVDLAKLRIATEQQTNFLPHKLGPCMLRPGTQYIAEVPGDAEGWLGEFYFDESTKTLLVATAAGLQFLINDAWVSRGTVTAAITNGDFDTDLSGWTNSDEAGAVSAWATGGYMSLIGTGTNYAWRDQQVTVNEPNTEHALRLVVKYGTVALRVGTSIGDNAFWDVSLLPGAYSLAFTPTGNFWVRLGANADYAALVDSIAVEPAGAVSLPVPWGSKADFDTIRYDQSGDVLFVASKYQQRRIERRASDSRSWGIATYLADDGPFRLGNTGPTTLTPSGVSGSITLAASETIFHPGHVGALFKITESGQTATAVIGGANQFTGYIRVSGLSNLNKGDPAISSRAFSFVISGTWVGTVTVQRSFGTPGNWVDMTPTYTTNQSFTADDGLDNQIVYYRAGIKTGGYTSGSATISLVYANSVQDGVVRITAVTDGENASADVLSVLGSTNATSDWAEGEWSDYRGWPAAVALHDGRLFWEPGIKIQGSVSDAFASFDAATIGDSGPINRTIATGGLDGGRWLLSLQRLIIGTASREISVRSSAFDEPLTPTAFVARDCSTRGVAKLRSLKVDTVGIYVGRNAQYVYELQYEVAAGDYRSQELTKLKQEMCAAGIVDVAVQRQPDTRIWFPLGDGTAAVLTYDVEEEVRAWVPVSTQGSFERSAGLPGSSEDDLYFIVTRTIGGVTKRYIEKLAKRSDCVGGTISKTLDSHIVYSGSPTTTIAGLGHLEGKDVVVWGDGAPQVTADAPKTVSGGQITGLPVAVSNAVVGLAYTGRIKTAKLAYAAERGTAVTMKKRIARIGLVMADVAWQGVKTGRDFSNLKPLPATYRGKPLTDGQVLASYDDVPGPFNGAWDSDSRACIEVTSPYCATIMGLVLQEETNEPSQAAPRDAG